MWMRMFLPAVMVLLASAQTPQPELQRLMEEPNLEKRSKLALDNARIAYQNLREAYDRGETAKVAAAAKEIEDLVELANESLKQTGKVPRKSPKYFKAAEIATRDLLRRIENTETDMSFEDRPVLESVKKKLQQVHEELLVGLMEGKRK